MAYEFVDTAAYRLRLPVNLESLLGTFHAFTMPEDWPDIIRNVYAAKRGMDSVDESWPLPISRVNHTLRALCPDVLYAGYRVTPTSTTPVAVCPPSCRRRTTQTSHAGVPSGRTGGE